MSSTTCTSLPQLEKVHTIAGTTQRSRAQVHPPTTPCAVDALLQYSTRALTSCVLHMQKAVENEDVNCQGWSAELCQTMLLGECWMVGGRVQLQVVGETRRAYYLLERSCCI